VAKTRGADGCAFSNKNNNVGVTIPSSKSDETSLLLGDGNVISSEETSVKVDRSHADRCKTAIDTCSN
jgi:hypothetical protein